MGLYCRARTRISFISRICPVQPQYSGWQRLREPFLLREENFKGSALHWVSLMAADLLGWLEQAAGVSKGRRSIRTRIYLFLQP